MIDLELPFGMLVSGSTHSGKTFMTRFVVDRLLRKGNIEPRNLFIFSPSYQLSGDWNPIIQRYPGVHIYEKFESKYINQIKNAQLKISKGKGRDFMPDVLVILDDLGSTRVFRNSGGPLADLASKGRHYRISYCVLVQNLTMLDPTVRINASYIAFFRVNNLSEVDRFVDEYGMRSQRRSFYDMFEQLFRTPYQFLFCDKRNHQYYINGHTPWTPTNR